MGVVLKNRKEQVLIFEANSGTGVSTIFWDWQLIRHKWYQDINRIAWRRLSLERDKDFVDDLQEFVAAELGSSFGIDLLHLFTGPDVSKIRPRKSQAEETLPTEIPEGKTREMYFCSQLVAKAYKTMGLIDQNRSSKKYWPKDFSDRGQLKLLRGELQPERIIVFDEQLLDEKYSGLRDCRR